MSHNRMFFKGQHSSDFKTEECTHVPRPVPIRALCSLKEAQTVLNYPWVCLHQVFSSQASAAYLIITLCSSMV